jgi:YidC/Oxa1 family membrane protein insertase
MVLALGVILAWQAFLRWKWPEWYATQGKAPSTQTSSVSPSSGPATMQATTAPATTTPATTMASSSGGVTTAPSAATWRARGDEKAAEPKTIGSIVQQDKSFAMGVEVFARGAAINAVTLNEFRKTAEDTHTPYVFQEPYQVDGAMRDDTRSLATRSITIDGHEVDVANVAWKLEGSAANSVSYSLDVLNGETPVAHVVKTYTVTPRSDDPNSPQGYELGVSHRVVNLTGNPITFKATLNGPTAPPRELERQADQNFIFAYTADSYVKVFSHLIESDFNKETTWKEYTRSEKGWPMLWAGAQSAYFNAIAKPMPLDPKDVTPTWIAKVYGLELNPATEKSEDRRVVMRMETGDITIAAKEAKQLDIDAYFGPKGRKVLETAYYQGYGRQYNMTLVLTASSGIAWVCSVCTWQWLINVLVWMLTAFHFVTRDWGLAIIGLVLLVRLVLHPITKKSQVHMVKMQKMGPEMEKLKKKYADDKDALAKAQMQFYKEQGMTPVFGCLPMFLQMPIWIALWNSLQSTFELRQAPFLYGFTWIKDLSKPDGLIHFSQPIPLLFGMHMSGVNILPLLMAVVMYFQTKLQPKPAVMTPEQAQQQKMMTWMSTLLFPFMLYTGPSGLNLYIMTSTAFGIIESKVIRKHIKEREELEKLGPTIIDAPPPDKRGGGGKKIVEEPQKGWLERLQDRAEQIRNAEKKRR